MIESVKRFCPSALPAVAERIADGDVEQPQLGIDGRRFPDATAIALAADPCWTGNLPSLIFFVLRHRVEVPEDLAGLRIDGEDVTTRNVALASSASDVEHALVHLWSGGEPVPHADGSLGVRVSRLEHIEDDAGLAVLAETGKRFAGLGVERKQEGAARHVDDAVGIADAAVAEDVAFSPPASEEIGDVIGPQQVAIDRIHRVDASAGVGHIHDLVHDDGCGLIADPVDDTVLEEPSWRERLHVGRIDLIQRRESTAGEIEIVERPVHRPSLLGR